jgi:hypothetical protein
MIPDSNKFEVRDEHQTLYGRLVTCTKCGRKLVVYAVETMPRSKPILQADCLECLEVLPRFRADHPEVAAQIDGWKASAKQETT